MAERRRTPCRSSRSRTRGTRIRRAGGRAQPSRRPGRTFQQLVVAAIFRFLGGGRPPRRPIAGPQRFVVALVRFDVREHQRVLCDQERVAPARRRDDGHAGGAASEYPRDRGAHLEAPPRLRARWVQLGVLGELRGLGRRHRLAVSPDQPAPIGVHGERHHGIGEPLAVDVQVQDRVHEGVTERMVERLVGVGDVDAFAQQPGDELLRADAVPFDRERRVGRFVPPVLATLVTLPGLNVDRVVGQHRERRHAILAIVLVLVVAPQQHEIGLERIELGADLAEVVDHVAPMLLGVAQSFVGGPLSSHRRMPVRGRPQRLGQQRVGEQELDAPAEVALVTQWRVVRDAKAEKLSHNASHGEYYLHRMRSAHRCAAPQRRPETNPSPGAAGRTWKGSSEARR